MDSLIPYNPFKEHRKGTPYNEEQLNYIYELVQLGWTANQIAKKFSISVDSIKSRIKNNDWSPKKTMRTDKLNNDELKEIYNLVLSGENNDIICKKYNISNATLMNRIINQRWEPVKERKKYTFNEHYFDFIDDEHKAYWLGFLYADGYILSKRERKKNCDEPQSFGFAISEKDAELLTYFKQDLEASNPVHFYKGSTYNKEGIYGRILLTSQHTVNKLKENGVIENKTFLLKFPSIEKKLIPAFIRGYSDGDGSIIIDKNNKYYWQILGTKEVLTGIQEFFGTNVKLYQQYPERKNNNYTLNYCGNCQVPKLLKIIYDGSTIALKRKKDKYAEMQGDNG